MPAWLPRTVTLLLVAVLFATTVVQSVFGFGQALLAVPLLIGHWPPPVLVPLLALVSLTIAATVVRRSDAAVDGRLLGWLAASASIGVPIGVWLVARIDAEALRTGLG